MSVSSGKSDVVLADSHSDSVEESEGERGGNAEFSEEVWFDLDFDSDTWFIILFFGLDLGGLRFADVRLEIGRDALGLAIFAGRRHSPAEWR